MGTVNHTPRGLAINGHRFTLYGLQNPHFHGKIEALFDAKRQLERIEEKFWTPLSTFFDAFRLFQDKLRKSFCGKFFLPLPTKCVSPKNFRVPQ